MESVRTPAVTCARSASTTTTSYTGSMMSISGGETWHAELGRQAGGQLATSGLVQHVTCLVSFIHMFRTSIGQCSPHAH